MAVFDVVNTAVNPVVEQVSLASVSNTKEAFLDWLNHGNIKKNSPESILSCLERISEYAIRKKISSISIWEYTQASMFQSMYKKLMGEITENIDTNTYKVFGFVGQLYLRFLELNPYGCKDSIDAVIIEDKGVKSATEPKSFSKATIDPQAVITWLITQPNANGTLYIENVVRQYMSALRFVPSKLELPVEVKDISVFSCNSQEELINCWGILKTAPNYRQINELTSGMFSAGMSCLLRYLQHITEDTPKRQGLHRVGSNQRPNQRINK